jgi:branched-chain amino acid transport system substrate-binding protein
MKKIIITIVALTLVPVVAHASITIKIGLLAPLTGDLAQEGNEMLKVVSLMADETNASGGLLGKNIEIITKDYESNPNKAIIGAQKLSHEKVVAVIGPFGSLSTEATQIILDQEGILQVAIDATANRLTQKGFKSFFRVSPSDEEHVISLFNYLKRMGFKKVAILDDNRSSSQWLATETIKLLRKESIGVLLYDRLIPDEKD